MWAAARFVESDDGGPSAGNAEHLRPDGRTLRGAIQEPAGKCFKPMDACDGGVSGSPVAGDIFSNHPNTEIKTSRSLRPGIRSTSTIPPRPASGNNQQFFPP